jgi:hypothetical protein
MIVEEAKATASSSISTVGISQFRTADLQQAGDPTAWG